MGDMPTSTAASDFGTNNEIGRKEKIYIDNKLVMALSALGPASTSCHRWIEEKIKFENESQSDKNDNLEFESHIVKIRSETRLKSAGLRGDACPECAGDPWWSCATCGRRGHAAQSATHCCARCAKAFTCASHLRMHMRTHTGERPYACDQCGATFSQQGTVKRHRRIHSNEEEPYECDVCDGGRAFRYVQSLQQHLGGHFGATFGRRRRKGAEMTLERHGAGAGTSKAALNHTVPLQGDIVQLNYLCFQ